MCIFKELLLIEILSTEFCVVVDMTTTQKLRTLDICLNIPVFLEKHPRCMQQYKADISQHAPEIFCHVDLMALYNVCWREMTSRNLTLSQPECNLKGNNVTSSLTTESQHQPYCRNGCHIVEYIVSNILMKALG